MMAKVKVSKANTVRIGSTLYAEGNSYGSWVSYKVKEETKGRWILSSGIGVNKATMRERADRYGRGRVFYTTKQHADLMWLNDHRVRAGSIVSGLHLDHIDILRDLVNKLSESGFKF
jgi:hypothetical protein